MTKNLLMKAADNIRRWREAPQVMVRELFGVTPDYWQDEALIAFPTNPRLCMKACAGPGKAQPLDSAILLADQTWITMGKVRPGMNLASPDGQRSIVKNVYPQGKQEIYRLTLEGGENCEATADHLWEISHGDLRCHEVVRTQDIKTLQNDLRISVRIPMMQGEYREVIGVEKSREAEAQCIRVSHPSRLYVTDDGILTHNTALLAWLGWNYMLTRPHPMVGATSITGDNLRSNLWTEFIRWHEKCDILKSMFDVTKTEIVAKDHPKTWKIEARTWAKDADADAIGNALRGLHADYVMWLLDESGDYPDAILPVCENIFSGNPVEAHIVQAGNPTRSGGPLYRACTTARELWKVVEITGDPDDPKRSPRISLEHAREQIRQYGRDNPWVMINILGQFPPQSLNALIGPDEVRAAMNRMYREHELRDSAKVIAADVAREGADQSVIAKRHGLQMFPLMKYRNVDGIQGGSILVREWEAFEADACFVDATGGFGWTWIEQARRLGRQPIPVQFSGDAHEKHKFFNKRAEMAFDFVDWIRRGGAIPHDERLLAALTQTTYTHKGDRLILEPKDQIKVKIGFSPDEMDAAMETLAEPVAGASRRRRVNQSAAAPDYDPFASAIGDAGGAYDPYR